MKKVFFFVFISMLVSCGQISNKYGQGGRNAAQFVKEQVPGLKEDIVSVETIGEDSLLSDIGLMFASIRAGNIKSAYYEGKVTYGELCRVLDSCKVELMNVEHSWKYGTVSKKIEKFNGQWRKVYTVRVTMKSGVTKEPRVLMEQDGTTPRMLEMDFFDKLRKYQVYFTH